MVPLRDTALQGELNKQNSNDTLRAKFATQANTVGAYIQAKMEVISPPTHSSPTDRVRGAFSPFWGQHCATVSWGGVGAQRRVIS